MSRGPGARQREILRRLRLIRSESVPDLWHALSGEPDRPWPNPNYPGSWGEQNGQSLSLYGRGTPRKVKVAYRRAARLLQLSGQVEVKQETRTSALSVRLPMSPAEAVAALTLRRRYRAFTNTQISRAAYAQRISDPEVQRREFTRIEAAKAQEQTFRRWFERVDKYRPKEGRNPNTPGRGTGVP
ncbi:hypothetical protein ACWIGW_44315 [Nocardia brasiliensis]|uniref:hypothetical protein n=1 Tax=Streptomyces sp. NPDC056056 TaxID=3345698 RepID=UPI0035D84984